MKKACVFYLYSQFCFMANTIAQKLKIQPGFTLLTLNAPDNYKKDWKDCQQE